MPSYPLFREPQDSLSLANRVVQVAREFKLDLIHAHYADPACDGRVAGQASLESGGHSPVVPRGDDAPRDRHHAGRQRSVVLEIVAFSIERSDGVTAVSQSRGRHAHGAAASRVTSR